jgi:SAM-dependent methyltransferase
MNEQINREKDVHGARWNTIHDGYFADPVVAEPLIGEIRKVARISKPDTIVDLGGGTGFLLSCLVEEGIEAGVSLIDLDDSLVQLESANSAGLSSFHGAVDSFKRSDILSEEGRCLFVMRSVLHYFGRDGLRPVLRHLRAQARPGEFFVHQTASFRESHDADVLNELYATMKSRKWYPDVDFLSGCM